MSHCISHESQIPSSWLQTPRGLVLSLTLFYITNPTLPRGSRWLAHHVTTLVFCLSRGASPFPWSVYSRNFLCLQPSLHNLCLLLLRTQSQRRPSERPPMAIYLTARLRQVNPDVAYESRCSAETWSPSAVLAGLVRSQAATQFDYVKLENLHYFPCWNLKG